MRAAADTVTRLREASVRTAADSPDAVTITADMTGDQIFSRLQAAGVTAVAKASLAGILQWDVAPEVVSI